MPFEFPLRGDEISNWLDDYWTGKPLDLHPRIRVVAHLKGDQWHFLAGRIDATQRSHTAPAAAPAFKTPKLAFMEWKVEDLRNLVSAEGRTHIACRAGDREMLPLKFDSAYVTLVGDRATGGPYWRFIRAMRRWRTMSGDQGA